MNPAPVTSPWITPDEAPAADREAISATVPVATDSAEASNTSADSGERSRATVPPTTPTTRNGSGDEGAEPGRLPTVVAVAALAGGVALLAGVLVRRRRRVV